MDIYIIENKYGALIIDSGHNLFSLKMKKDRRHDTVCPSWGIVCSDRHTDTFATPVGVLTIQQLAAPLEVVDLDLKEIVPDLKHAHF